MPGTTSQLEEVAIDEPVERKPDPKPAKKQETAPPGPPRKAKTKMGLGHGKQRRKRKPPATTSTAMATTSASGIIRSGKWKKGNGEDDEYDTNHQDFCEECHAGGDILLCDTCPKAYHLVCLDPPLDKPPEGAWQCSTCAKDGGASGSTGPSEPAEEAYEDEEDEHQEYCKICKLGGQLLCCAVCPTTYHLGCLNPPLLEVPEGEWICPRCSVSYLR